MTHSPANSPNHYGISGEYESTHSDIPNNERTGQHIHVDENLRFTDPSQFGNFEGTRNTREENISPALRAILDRFDEDDEINPAPDSLPLQRRRRGALRQQLPSGLPRSVPFQSFPQPNILFPTGEIFFANELEGSRGHVPHMSPANLPSEVPSAIPEHPQELTSRAVSPQRLPAPSAMVVQNEPEIPTELTEHGPTPSAAGPSMPLFGNLQRHPSSQAQLAPDMIVEIDEITPASPRPLQRPLERPGRYNSNTEELPPQARMGTENEESSLGSNSLSQTAEITASNQAQTPQTSVAPSAADAALARNSRPLKRKPTKRLDKAKVKKTRSPPNKPMPSVILPPDVEAKIESLDEEYAAIESPDGESRDIPQFSIAEIHYVFVKTPDLGDEICAICKNRLDQQCITCESGNDLSKKCIPQFGECSHAFHDHCLSEWHKTQREPTCPTDSKKWVRYRF